MKSLNFRFCLGIFLMLLISGSASSGNSGHMLDSIELIPGEEVSYLSLKGYFEPELFENIRISQGETAMQKQLTIPQAFINNLMMPEREITEFPGEGIITRILLEEEIQEDDTNRVSFLVNLQIALAQELELKLEINKSSPRQLTFSLQPRYGVTEPAEKEVALESPSELEKPPMDSVLLHPVFAMLAYRKPFRLNLAVLDASGKLGSAQRLAVVLEQQQRRRIEQRIGMRLEVVNISSVPGESNLRRTKIYYRPNMLKAAVILAEVIPGEQIVEQFPAIRGMNQTTDIEIYVGQNFH